MIVLVLLFIHAGVSSERGICHFDHECGHGFCKVTKGISFGLCQCNYGWTAPYCSYKQFDGIIVGGLQFFSLIGAGGIGNFILGHLELAIPQLVISFFLFLSLVAILVLLCPCIALYRNYPVLTWSLFGITLFLYLGCIAWNISDGIRMILNQVIDSHGFFTV